jgi:serine/threonine protein kinase
MAELVGRTILNRYRVDAFLGKGGMAEVYKVWDMHRSAYLAMKVLNPDLAVDRVFLRRFKREAQTLERLQHPNIVRFYGLEQEGHLVFMLIDYVEGQSLKLKIFDEKIPETYEQVMMVMRPLCQALQYANNEGLVHADVKPGNIMIDKTGRVLLADFGIARMTEAATATMAGAGTPAYMSPEQARGEDPTPQTDLYALGIVLYEILSGGERPFTGEHSRTTGSTGEKIRWEQLNLQPPSLRLLNSRVTPQLEAVVFKCLEKDPGKRYASAIDLLNALSAPQPLPSFSRQVPENQERIPHLPTNVPNADEPNPNVSTHAINPISYPTQVPIQHIHPLIRKHSPLGIASLILGILSIICVCLVFGGFSLTPSQTMDADAISTMIVILITVTLLMSVVGMGLGIGGIVQKARRKSLAITGIVLNSLVVAGLSGSFLVILIALITYGV